MIMMIMVKLNQRPKTRTCIVACTGCWRLCGCRLLRFRHRYQPRISQQQNTNCSKQTTQRIRNVNSEQMRKYSPWHELTNNANENAFLWLAILDTAFAAIGQTWPANDGTERRQIEVPKCIENCANGITTARANHRRSSSERSALVC